MSGSLAGELAAFRAHTRRNPVKPGRGSRGKKVYGITDAGRERLRELLANPDVAEDREFAIRMAFCHHLDARQRLALFVARRDELERRRAEQQSRPASQRHLTTYLRSLIERDSEATTADLAWLDRLIAIERSVEPASGAADHTSGGHR